MVYIDLCVEKGQNPSSYLKDSNREQIRKHFVNSRHLSVRWGTKEENLRAESFTGSTGLGSNWLSSSDLRKDSSPANDYHAHSAEEGNPVQKGGRPKAHGSKHGMA